MLKINQTYIDKLKPTGKQEQISLGFKLFLVMTPKGKKSYRYIFRTPGTNRIKKKNLGNANIFSLESALATALSFNALLKQGIDPIEYNKTQLQVATKKSTTLNTILEDWKITKGQRLSQKHLRDRLSRFNRYLLPYFNNQEIANIPLFKAREILKPLFDQSPNMANKIARDLNELCEHAIEMGILETNHLTLIKKSFPRPKVVNNPCINADKLPDFLQTLKKASINQQTKFLIEFQLLTMVRANEVVTAEWNEIDLINAVWHIPAQKMKMKKAHNVPLSTQAIHILLEIRKLTGNTNYVFPHRINKNAHCSSNTANQAFHKILGYKGKMTPHGMRSLARTWLADNNIGFEVAEACLSHESGTQVSKAYNRTNYFNQRIEAMQMWGNFVASCHSN